MRIRVLSDLHIQHEHNAWRDVPTVDCDVTVLIGDVTNPMTLGLEWVARTFGAMPIIYVPGNHDFYRGVVGSGEENTHYADQMARGREMATRLGISLLQNEIEIVDGVRFIGATMWSDFSVLPAGWTVKDAMQQSQKGWTESGGRYWDNSYHNDFREIRFGGGSSRHRFTPSQMLGLHRESRNYFEAELAKQFDGDTICVTHMGPAESVERGIHSWLYGWSDLQHTMHGPLAPRLWLHGHVHKNCDYVIGDTRVLCNARGYALGPNKSENPDFVPDFVVEVEPAPKPSLGM